ncbi:MAG: hypothetical protein Q8Q88_16575 [Phenylobacterium sp.]|uniref:hypothetical protein n=1 Tax=Phenylobacterium sp. TaxID=1871053 RepID=UPI002733FBC3|nr:hypothetical protein [Phenylobacterium sp.]MDP3748655.1 hypothetical protein [Phenylobacterium sp.]
MQDVFHSYWWLIFPLAAFAFGAWDRWLAYSRSRAHLELIKTYAAQGKEPPPELMKRIQEEEDDDEESDWSGLGRRHRRNSKRHSRHDDIRRVIFTGALAGAFWIAAEASLINGTEGPFRLVALILVCISGATLLSVLVTSRFRDR